MLDLCNNILSIGQLQKKGLAILIQNNKCKVYHPNRGPIIETTMSLNRMFILLATIKPQEQHCFQTLSHDSNYLLHCHYGHLSLDELKTLYTKQMIHGLPQLKKSNLFCEDCMIGKQHRSPFLKKVHGEHLEFCSLFMPISVGTYPLFQKTTKGIF